MKGRKNSRRNFCLNLFIYLCVCLFNCISSYDLWCLNEEWLGKAFLDNYQIAERLGNPSGIRPRKCQKELFKEFRKKLRKKTEFQGALLRTPEGPP